jgi:hypothetical protein
VISSAVQSNGNVVITGNAGPANGSYRILTSTNVSLPIAQWTAVATNQFNQSGEFSAALPIVPETGQLFYLIQLQ